MSLVDVGTGPTDPELKAEGIWPTESRQDLEDEGTESHQDVEDEETSSTKSNHKLMLDKMGNDLVHK
jgi:hypothetical protein